jgi:predicted nucleic acid-binding Zn ribbon protein/YHS domain-containing protein
MKIRTENSRNKLVYLNMPEKTCIICKKPIEGRSDKLFCSVYCKNQYHIRLRRATSKAVKDINSILARNRSILLELLGKNKGQKKIQRNLLDKKKFNFNYHTHFHINSRGKTYYYCYDIAWMEFSDNDVLIIKPNE